MVVECLDGFGERGERGVQAVLAQLLMTPSSSQTLHHQRIGTDASACATMLIRP